HAARRQQVVLRPSGGHGRRRSESCRGGAVMRAFPRVVVAAVVALSLAPASLSAQKSPVPRAAGGKPDLTGVWQGGSTIRGSWEGGHPGRGVGGHRHER